MPSRREIDPVMMDAYRAPFPDYWSRVGMLAFQRDIPLTERDRSAGLMGTIHERLVEIDVPVTLVWGMRDPVFQPVFLDQWRELFPDAPETHWAVGRFRGSYVGHVAEDGFRMQGSSGGMVSWVLAELLRRELDHVEMPREARPGENFHLILIPGMLVQALGAAVAVFALATYSGAVAITSPVDPPPPQPAKATMAPTALHFQRLFVLKVSSPDY